MTSRESPPEKPSVGASSPQSTVRINSGEDVQESRARQASQTQAEASGASSLISFTVFAANALVAIALLLTGVVLIQMRAEADSPEAAASLISVQSLQIQQQAGFAISERFSGRIEASQVTDVAFEAGGTVMKMHVNEGDRVRKGDIVASLDTRTLQAQRVQRQASRRQLSAAVERATLDLQRELELERRGLTADQSLDNARLLLEQASAAVDEMDAVLDTLTIAIEKAAALAPFTGIVGARYLDEGSVAGPGTRIISLFDADNPEVVFGLPLDRVKKLVVGQPYPVFVDNQHFNATYLRARPDLNRQTRTVDAHFAIDTSTGMQQLPVFGQLAELELVHSIKKTGYWVPITALVEGERNLWSLLSVHAPEVQTNTPAEQGEQHLIIPNTDQVQVQRVHVDIVHTQASQVFVQAYMGDTAIIVKDGGHRVVPGQRVVSASDSR